jgi:acetyl esterase/lipase
MKKITLMLLLTATLALAQVPRGEPTTFPLWTDAAPGALGKEDVDIPTLTYFPTNGRSTSGTSVIIAPGGGYQTLAANHEGRQWANWFNAMGVTAFVLKYRLGPKYHHPVELGDAQRAIRLVRSRAMQYGISPDRIGMMGFSAGGHLASTAGTHFDVVDGISSRPDFLLLAYPVISLNPEIAHGGSSRNLLGENPDPALVTLLSNELQVTPQTPPTFLFHTANDSAVPVENSIRFFQALRKNNVPAEMHIFENGPHGVGLSLENPALAPWPGLLANWMRSRGLLTK